MALSRCPRGCPSALARPIVRLAAALALVGGQAIAQVPQLQVVATLEAALGKVVGDPALKPRFADIGFDPTAISAAEAAAIMRKTAGAWAPLIRRLAIRLD